MTHRLRSSILPLQQLQGPCRPMDIRVDFYLNDLDEIISVGQEWDDFALKNGAPELAGGGVIGRPLLDFVSGNVTRHFVETLLLTARAGSQPVELDYRCDSPDERRYMHMRVSLADNNTVCFSNTLLRTELRSKKIFINKAAQRSRNTPVRCSMCNLLLSKSQWIEPEHIFESGPGETHGIFVIYGICSRCFTELQSIVAPAGVPDSVNPALPC